MPGKNLKAVSASPLYAQLMEQLRLDILRGAYPVGEKIPAEHELERRYGVSRVTVRRALQELESAGLLERKQGKGTFVAPPKAEEIHRDLQGFHEVCKSDGRRPSAELIGVTETEAPEGDSRLLGLPAGARMLEIRRVLRADAEPVILETHHFSMAYSWLETAELTGSLYGILQEYGIHPEKSIYDISLVSAGPQEAAWLEIPEGTAVMAVMQVVYDQRGRPLHICRQLIRGDRYTLRI